MNEKELRELDGWIAEHVMGWRLTNYETGRAAKWDIKSQNNDGYTWNGADEAWTWKPTSDPDAAMHVLKRCYQQDRNSCLGSLHNFLMRKEHDTSLTELQICLFAKQLFSEKA